MVGFLILMAVSGCAASFIVNWVFLSVVGMVVLPAGSAIMVLAGNGVGFAVAHALVGYGVLQIAFVASGAAAEFWRGRRVRASSRVDEVPGDTEPRGGA